MSNLTPKQKTQQSYNQTALQYEINMRYLLRKENAERFLSILPKNGTILDIGCGPGRDAQYFSEKGLQVVGIDFSEEMIKLAKEVAPRASFAVTDIEQMRFGEKSFQGAWANTSLLHISKELFPQVLQNIHQLLADDGIFYLCLKKGSGQGLEPDVRYGNCEKFWNFFEEKEILNILEESFFEIIDRAIYYPENSYQKHPLLDIFCRKRSP